LLRQARTDRTLCRIGIVLAEIEIECQVDLQICKLPRELVRQDVSALLAGKPADKEFRFPSLVAQAMEKSAVWAQA